MESSSSKKCAFKADLHCHSTCSDGTCTPEELVDLAIERGLSGLSITDHDSFDAYEVAIPYAKERKLLLGVGAEFSTYHEGKRIDVLAYDFERSEKEINELVERHKTRRKERNRKIIEKLQEKGFELSEEELYAPYDQLTTIGRPHIAQLMIEKGYVKDMKEAFQLYLADGKSCFVSVSTIGADETLDIIHKAGGKAFIAHPQLIKPSRFVHKLLKLPFDGIECYYSRTNPREEQRWLKVAEKHNLLVSGGSDFHGLRRDVQLGNAWVDEEKYGKIFIR